MSWLNTAPSIVSRASLIEALEVAHLALAEDEDAGRLEVLVEAGEREAGLLDVRAGDRPIEAAAPLSSSSGRPIASDRLCRSRSTVNDGVDVAAQRSRSRRLTLPARSVRDCRRGAGTGR